mgnify:CR=1 FL=1
MGDMVVDVVTGDVGILLNRFDIMKQIHESLGEETEDRFQLWAWDILWCGQCTNTADISRHQPFTEEGLVNLIRSGTFVIKNRV